MNCRAAGGSARVEMVRVGRERTSRMINDRLSDVGRLSWFASGRRTKWFIVGFWVLVFVVAGSAAGKLSSVQDNDSASWLPGDAESTQMLDRMAAFQSPNEIPALVVYERSGGITPEDQKVVADQVVQFNDLDGVERDSLGPFPSEDGQALQVIVPIDVGAGGWEALGKSVDDLHG